MIQLIAGRSVKKSKTEIPLYHCIELDNDHIQADCLFIYPQNIFCGYSFESSRRDDSDEHHSNRFRGEITKLLMFLLKNLGLFSAIICIDLFYAVHLYQSLRVKISLN